MSKTANSKIHIDSTLKDEVEHLFAELGLSVDEAITLFYQQVKFAHGLPFEVKTPNKLTRKVFEDTDANRNLIRCESSDDMFRKLGI